MSTGRPTSGLDNGRRTVTAACGKCPACLGQGNGRCEKPVILERLPDPCCTFCGHNPHAGVCRGCPCVRRQEVRHASTH